jgi:hypothetical protein
MTSSGTVELRIACTPALRGRGLQLAEDRHTRFKSREYPARSPRHRWPAQAVFSAENHNLKFVAGLAARCLGFVHCRPKTSLFQTKLRPNASAPHNPIHTKTDGEYRQTRTWNRPWRTVLPRRPGGARRSGGAGRPGRPRRPGKRRHPKREGECSRYHDQFHSGPSPFKVPSTIEFYANPPGIAKMKARALPASYNRFLPMGKANHR